MIYLIPPTTDQPSWRIRTEYQQGTRSSGTFNIREEVMKVFADNGVPVILQGKKPTGATEEALVAALEVIDSREDIKINKRLIKDITVEIDILSNGSSMYLLPQIFWDCRRAADALEEAQNRYAKLHEKLMEYALAQLGLTELQAILVEGTHECINSPTRKCLYDDEEDPSHDTCLVCGEPE